MNQTDYFILKYKTAGKSDDIISKKLGMSVKAINERHAQLVAEAETRKENGFMALRDQWTIMCHQYELLGQSMVAVGQAFGNLMPPEEMKQLITSDPEETLRNFQTKAIILRQYVPPPVQVPETNNPVTS